MLRAILARSGREPHFSRSSPVPFRPLTLAAFAALAVPAATLAQAPATQAPPTRAVMIQNIDARFAEIDTNKDGFLATAEIAAAQTQALQQAMAVQQQRIESEFNKLDTNKDKQLSLAEFKAVAAAVRPSSTPAQMIAGLDSSKDGKVSKDEYRAAPLAGFDRADANKNGTIDAQEAQALRQR
jgi:hypothetical protein